MNTDYNNYFNKYLKYKNKYLNTKNQTGGDTGCERKTEPAFNNEYYNNFKKGLYFEKVSNIPLFSSKDKFDSGTGWPSFRKPINPTIIKFSIEPDGRIEVHTDTCHLGHLFLHETEKEPIRYCMNSKALIFIPYENLTPEQKILC